MQTSELILAIAPTLLACAALWFSLWWRHRNQASNTHALFTMVLVAGLAVRLAYVFMTPIFYAPDEQSHFNYIKHLAEKKSFPVQTSQLGDESNDWENHQPPLYYLVAATVFSVTQALFHNQTSTVFAIRLFSVSLWLLNVWLVIVSLRRMNIKDCFVQVFVVAMVSLLPTYTFISSMINNDNLLATIGAGLVCLLTQRARSIKSALFLGLLVGLGLLIKQSAVIFAPLIVSLVALEAFKARISWGSAAQQFFVTLGLAGLIYLPWAIRNWLVYNTFMPEHLVVTQIPWPSAMQGIASATHNLLKTFWSVSGLTNDVGYPFPVVGMLLLVLPVIMFALDSKPVEKTDALNIADNKSLLIAMFIAVLITVGLVLRFGYQFGMGQGRHLFLLLCPIALFLAVWLRRLPVKKLEVHAAGFWITYAASFAVFSLCRVPR